MAEQVKRLRKKKKWFAILASKEFKEQRIGETMAFEPKQIVGRKVKINLGALIGDFKKQNKAVTFVVKEVQGQDAFTELVQFEIPVMHIKRFVRKEKDRVDDSFKVQTKDGANVQIKILLLTRAHTQRSVQTALRHSIRDFLSKDAKEKDYAELVYAVVSGNLQKAIKSQAKKVYPLTVAEIRMMRKL